MLHSTLQNEFLFVVLLPMFWRNILSLKKQPEAQVF